MTGHSSCRCPSPLISRGLPVLPSLLYHGASRKERPGLLGKAGEEGASLSNGFPRGVKTVAFVGRHFSEHRVSAVNFRQRRIINFFVAAQVVFAAETARGDFHQVAGF